MNQVTHSNEVVASRGLLPKKRHGNRNEIRHTLFIDNGSVFAMGSNLWGAIKNDNTLEYRTPQFTGIQNAVSIAAGSNRSAVLKADGTVTLFGRPND